MLEVERNELLKQVGVILQQCQMIVSRLSSSSSAPVHVVCQCQPSAPILDHNDNYWWDGYTAQLTKFSSEFYSLLSPTYDDLFDDDEEDEANPRPAVSMSSSITSSSGEGTSMSTSYEQECNTHQRKCHDVHDHFQTKMLVFLTKSCPSDVYNRTWREDRLRSALVDPDLFPLWSNCHLLFLEVLEVDEDIDVENFSPEIKYHTIDLSNVNSRFIENIPKPSYIPIQGVSQDPDLYHKEYPRNDYYHVQRYFKFNEPHPFGSAYGYETDIGIVPPPTDPVHGYVWQGGGWKLHAVEPGQSFQRGIQRRRRG